MLLAEWRATIASHRTPCADSLEWRASGAGRRSVEAGDSEMGDTETEKRDPRVVIIGAMR
jgi:hypothetical protein